jgi:two-component system NtrC family sensor kinase
MFDVLNKLPAVLILGAVVATFVSLYRNHRSARTRLWLAAWVLMLLRAIVQAAAMELGASEKFANAFDLAALQFSGMLFFLSGTRIFEVPRLRPALLVTLCVPAVVYGILFGYSVELIWPYVVLILVLMGSTAAWTLWFFGREIKGYQGLILITAMMAGGYAAYRIFGGRYDLGYYSIETLVYAFAGTLFWRNYKRFSPGVLLTSLGFLAWASVFPILYALEGSQVAYALIEVANVPKIIVALGMIVTLLEEESISASAAREQERSTRNQLQRFFDVTSRLLTGVDAPGICNHIAQVITETSNFQRVAILLTDDQRNMYVAGASGIDAAASRQIQESVSKLTVDVLNRLCPEEARIGANSFRTTTNQLRSYGGQPNRLQYPRNPHWNSGDEIIVPLRSPRGVLFGCISLDDPRNVERVNAEELSAVELLAADLAVAIENANLQKQLLRSEKLAGIGQLVSGAAHELNNPLTAVLGYTEMLAESVPDEAARRDLGIVRREAMRMKQIIENLLRFARQTKFERSVHSLAVLVDDVLKLRAYELRSQGILLSKNVPEDLPGVLVEENLLKQVFLNILNNALDAVASRAEKRVSIEASSADGRVQIRFTDNGAGFSDLNRVFDPFFTTKSPGKGTGLGLSICYGIIKEHGGDITAYNLHPSGAGIMIELPAAEIGKPQPEKVGSASRT